MLVTPYWVPIVGGVTTCVLNLAKELDNFDDVEVEVIALEGNDENICINSRSKSTFVLKSFSNLLKIKPTVLHSHSWWYTLMPCVMYKLSHPDCILIHTFHTDPVINEQLSFITKCKNEIFTWLLNKTDVVTFVANNTLQKYEKISNINSRKAVIYNGVSKREIDLETVNQYEAEYSLDNHYPVISWIGPFEHKKKVDGIKLLFEAFKSVIKKYHGAKLLIIGDGPYRNDLEIFADQLRINDSVLFTGFLDDVLPCLRLSDIYAHISFQEACPFAILEAMSVGTPVISIPIGGIPEIVVNGETGLLVDSDSSSISNGIIELCERKDEMKKFGNNALKLIENKLNWKYIANEYRELALELSKSNK